MGRVKVLVSGLSLVGFDSFLVVFSLDGSCLLQKIVLVLVVLVVLVMVMGPRQLLVGGEGGGGENAAVRKRRWNRIVAVLNHDMMPTPMNRLHDCCCCCCCCSSILCRFRFIVPSFSFPFLRYNMTLLLLILVCMLRSYEYYHISTSYFYIDS